MLVASQPTSNDDICCWRNQNASKRAMPLKGVASEAMRKVCLSNVLINKEIKQTINERHSFAHPFAHPFAHRFFNQKTNQMIRIRANVSLLNWTSKSSSNPHQIQLRLRNTRDRQTSRDRQTWRCGHWKTSKRGGAKIRRQTGRDRMEESEWVRPK